MLRSAGKQYWKLKVSKLVKKKMERRRKSRIKIKTKERKRREQLQTRKRRKKSKHKRKNSLRRAIKRKNLTILSLKKK